MSNVAKLSLTPASLDTAEGRTKEVLEAGKKSAGGIPNMYAGMAKAPALMDTYLHGYRLFRKESGFTPAEQELVFLSIARVNACPYCVAAHSFIAGASRRLQNKPSKQSVMTPPLLMRSWRR